MASLAVGLPPRRECSAPARTGLVSFRPWFSRRQAPQQDVEKQLEAGSARAEVEGVLLDGKPAHDGGDEDVPVLLGQFGRDSGVREGGYDCRADASEGVGAVAVRARGSMR